TRAIGRHVHDDPTPVGGGSIHSAFTYKTERAPIFVKVCTLAHAPLIEAEAAGLREIARTNVIRVPEVLALGKLQDRAFIGLEWLALSAPSRSAHAQLGEQLAALHAQTRDVHGWHQDNFIGLTPQRNDEHADWVEFFRTRRLLPQLELAERNGADARTIDAGHRLSESLGAFFAGYQPRPSLLHGDLWGGNWGAVDSSEPVIFDPAV